MAVRWQATGTGGGGLNAATIAWPTHVAGDIGILLIETADQAVPTSVTDAGWTEITNSPQSVAAVTRLSAFWKRAASSAEAGISTGDSGDHQWGVIITFRGAIGSGDPIMVTAGSTKATASTSISIAGVNTTEDDCEVLYAAARSNDSAAAAFSAQANASLTGLTERYDAGTAGGNGGGLGLWTGIKTTAGATGTLTATVTSSSNAYLVIALKAEPVAQTLISSARHDNAQTTYAPTLTPGDVTLESSARHDNALTTYAPTLTPGDVTIESSARHDNQQTTFSPTLVPDQVLESTARHDNAQTSYTPTLTPGDVTIESSARHDNAQTTFSPTLTQPSGNQPVGYATNSGGYSPSACYGVSPTTLVYHHPDENAQPGQILIGKVLYTNDDGTGALSAASTWWSFHKDGTAADRAIQIDGSGMVINAAFRNGVIFGYADEGGDCNSTSGFSAIYNAPDDYQYWYPRKAVDKTAAVIGGIQVAAGTQALSYVNTGSVIGTATFAQLNNYQNSYTSMTGCGVANRRKGRAMFFE